MNETRHTDGRGTFVIVNPQAGSGRAGRRWPDLAKRLRHAIGDFDHALTSGSGDATRLARQAIDAGAKCIDHGQLIDEATMARIAEEGIFLSANLGGMSPDLFKHPYYGNPANPAYHKARQFQDDASKFVALANKYQPKRVFNSDIVLSSREFFRQHMDYEKYISGQWFGTHNTLVAMTSRGGELAQLTGKLNPYPGKLGVIEEGALADILLVDGNPLEDLAAIGAHPGWFEAPERSEDVTSIRLIMKDGVIYKNTL